MADVGMSVGLREAAPKQVHLRQQQGRGWMFKTGSVAIDGGDSFPKHSALISQAFQ